MNGQDLRECPKLNISVIILHNKVGVFFKIINPLNVFGVDSGESPLFTAPGWSLQGFSL